jgi:Serine aminopeptidase, S33
MTTPSRIPREQVARLGRDGNVVGIRSDPPRAAGDPAPARPAVILLNAGVLHRVGPHRLHVNLARRLAEAGFPALRLDLSGIGDSDGVPGDLTFRESAVADTRAAMDQLADSLQAPSFILFGLCSGADNSLATAAADPRVAGVVLVDPPAYATVRSLLRRAFRPLPSPGSLASLATGVLRLARQRFGSGPSGPEGGRQLPAPAEFGAMLQRLADRDVKILALYSGIHGERYNAPDQLFEAFPALRGRLDLAWLPHANHVFTLGAHQQELITLVTGWCVRRFG